MDLIKGLAGALGINESEAKAVAGTALGAVQGGLGEKHGEEAAGQLKEAVPELDGWKSAAAQLTGGGGGAAGLLGGLMGGGGAGGLLGAAVGAVAGQQAGEIAGVVAILSKVGVDSTKAALVAPLVLDFLKKRVDSDLLSKILSAAPMLAAVAGGSKPEAAPAQEESPAAGLLGAAGALKGLFG